ncbi:MAG: glycosyltransferase family 39 protein [Candidatus Omnitrophica bacterium]|nr:glycosyltransferase family 39 protein [Candidatus Omnitrophota bacterium]
MTTTVAELPRKTPPRISVGRAALAVCAGVGLCAVVLAEVWWWRGGLVRLSLPIADERGFPLPVLYWASVALYTLAYNALLGARRSLADAVRLGFGVHLSALLATLVWQMTSQHGLELSIWYVRYWQVFWIMALAIGLVWTIRFMAAWRQAAPGAADGYLMPLVISYAGFWVSSAALNPWVTLLATALGLCAAIATGVARVATGAARLRQWVRRERVFLAGVFLLALGFRLFYTVRILHSPDFLNAGSDGPAYDALAWALAQGTVDPRWGNIPMFAPGYVRFLAAVYHVAGRNYFLVCALQSLIGASACLLLYSIGKRLFGVMVARVAAVFGALNFPMIFAAASIGHQALDLFWTLLVVWCLVRYVQQPARWGRWMLGIGALLGWATVTREGNGVFWLGLLGWLMLGMSRVVGWRKALWHAAMLSVGFLVVLSPFVAGKGGGLRGRMGAQWMINPNSSAQVRTWFNPWTDPVAARERLRQQPITVLVKVTQEVIGNFKALCLNQGYGSFDPVFLLRRSTYYYGLWSYAYVLAFIGLFRVLAQSIRSPTQRLGWWLILLVLVCRSLPHLFFESAYRHRVPMEPYVILLAAYGLFQLTKRSDRIEYHP